MGWESRARGGRYYVQKQRIGGKVVSRYLGGGEIGILAAQLDALQRQKREDARETERRYRADMEALDRQSAADFATVETILRQTLAAAGYHRHKRGEWRRRRDRNQGSGGEHADGAGR